MIYRKDVVTVAKELDQKRLEASVANIVKRLEKHFAGADDQVSIHNLIFF